MRIRDGIELEPGLSQESFRFAFRNPKSLAFFDAADFTLLHPFLCYGSCSATKLIAGSVIEGW